MAFPQALVTRFFQLINNRQFAEARRELQRLKEKIEKTEWNRGYYRALYGMLLAQKANGNHYTFLSKVNPTDKNALKQYKIEFMKHVKSRFHENSDRGYFSAWSDYMRLLIRDVEELEAKAGLEGQTSIVQYAEPTQKAV